MPEMSGTGGFGGGRGGSSRRRFETPRGRVRGCGWGLSTLRRKRPEPMIELLMPWEVHLQSLTFLMSTLWLLVVPLMLPLIPLLLHHHPQPLLLGMPMWKLEEEVSKEGKCLSIYIWLKRHNLIRPRKHCCHVTIRSFCYWNQWPILKSFCVHCIWMVKVVALPSFEILLPF